VALAHWGLLHHGKKNICYWSFKMEATGFPETTVNLPIETVSWKALHIRQGPLNG
jgi:hypothetical protein